MTSSVSLNYFIASLSQAKMADLDDALRIAVGLKIKSISQLPLGVCPQNIIPLDLGLHKSDGMIMF